MYKKYKDYLNILLVLMLVIVFGSIIVLIILTESICNDKKIELFIQIIGMFFTSFALVLTYSSLRNEQKQKHISVRPYLILENIDFAEENSKSNDSQLDFDFEISNKGVGIANRINVVIKKKNDNEIIFNEEYVRLNIDNDNTSHLLANIRDELNYMNSQMNDQKGCSYSHSPHFSETLSGEFYIKKYNNLEDYRKLVIEVVYYDIYGKKFKGTFNITLDNTDYDLEDIEETLEEWEY